MFRRRRPILGAAIVGGAAYQAGKRHEQGQADQAEPAELEAEQEPSMDDTIDQLAKLGQLHESGVLTDEEFARQKQRLLP